MSSLQQMLAAASIKNYATLDPANKGANVTLSGGNLSTSITSTLTGMVRSTIGKSSGKWYWEVTPTGGSVNIIGIANSSGTLTSYPGSDVNGFGYAQNALKWNSSSSAYGASFTTSDVIGVALDMDAGTLVFYKNNVSQGTAYTGLTGTMYAAVGCDSNIGTRTSTTNFGATALTYSPPSGYNAGLYS
jgi:hypothetical protein